MDLYLPEFVIPLQYLFERATIARHYFCFVQIELFQGRAISHGQNHLWIAHKVVEVQGHDLQTLAVALRDTRETRGTVT